MRWLLGIVTVAALTLGTGCSSSVPPAGRPRGGGDPSPAPAVPSQASAAALPPTRPGPTTRRSAPPPLNVDGIVFMPLPEGYFVMGSPADEPGRDPTEQQRLVPITGPMWLSATEITQAQYERVVGSNPSLTRHPDWPVTNATWDEARAFGTALGARHRGYRFQLPTEEVWEYACRAGAKLPFAAPPGQQAELERAWRSYRQGDADPLQRWLARVAWFNRDQPRAAGTLQANAWGLYDMHGNVWEWCDGEPADGTDLRPLRGGAWSTPDVLGLRAALRAREPRGTRKESIGFRILVLGDP